MIGGGQFVSSLVAGYGNENTSAGVADVVSLRSLSQESISRFIQGDSILNLWPRRLPRAGSVSLVQAWCYELISTQSGIDPGQTSVRRKDPS
jgi:hypothetical protein